MTATERREGTISVAKGLRSRDSGRRLSIFVKTGMSAAASGGGWRARGGDVDAFL
jgi:hypothetical protein